MSPFAHDACVAQLGNDLTIATVRTDQGRLFDMAVRLHNHDPMSRNIRNRGFWEIQNPQELADLAGTTLSQKINQSRYLLDIGANIGFYSLLFAHFGWHSIAVEPMPSNLRALNISLCLNPRLSRHVTVIPTALTTPEASGRCIIRSDNLRYGNGGIGNGILDCRQRNVPCVSEMHSSCYAVPTQTVDSMLRQAQPSRIDVVKVDIWIFEV